MNRKLGWRVIQFAVGVVLWGAVLAFAHYAVMAGWWSTTGTVMLGAAGFMGVVQWVRYTNWQIDEAEDVFNTTKT